MTEATPGARRRTPLYDAHVAAGAKLVDFAGWEMPIQYAGIKQEHQAVRNAVGVFDVSHMGQVRTRGPQALERLQRLVSNDVGQVPAHGAQYSLLCNPQGGVIDDLFSYRLGDDEFLTVTNAANHAKDLAWMQDNATEFEADVTDDADSYAMLAVQGPRARGLIRGLADRELPARFTCTKMEVAGIGMLVAGTGYTGEDGVELLIAPEQAAAAWAAIVTAGAEPVGLGARDTLRLEACFHLYGNDLSEDRDPIGAGLGWACKEATGFIGSDRIAQVRADGPSEKLVPFTISGAGIARQGNPVIGGGVVTSGTFSPSLEKGIGMVYVPVAESEPGTTLQIDVRGTIRDAVVQRKPLYRKDA